MIIKAFGPRVNDKAFFAGWIGAMFLVAGLCWFLTGSLRSDLLMRAVNRILAGTANRPVLEKTIPPRELGGAARMGSWFTVHGEGNRRALVFTLFAEGSFLPCVALVNSVGAVEEILPLGPHSEKMLARLKDGRLEDSRLQDGVLRFHIRRIEGALP